jgi:hypothetical protein
MSGIEMNSRFGHLVLFVGRCQILCLFFRPKTFCVSSAEASDQLIDLWMPRGQQTSREHDVEPDSADLQVNLRASAPMLLCDQPEPVAPLW